MQRVSGVAGRFHSTGQTEPPNWEFCTIIGPPLGTTPGGGVARSELYPVESFLRSLSNRS